MRFALSLQPLFNFLPHVHQSGKRFLPEYAHRASS
jgi:hypothetical protein